LENKILEVFFMQVKEVKKRKPITVTLTDDTWERVEFLADKFGLTKSQAISYAVNTLVIEKYSEELN
jgi:predicted DNA-binding protein